MTRSRLWIGIGALALAMMGGIGTDPSDDGITFNSLSIGGAPALAQVVKPPEPPPAAPPADEDDDADDDGDDASDDDDDDADEDDDDDGSAAPTKPKQP
jgi:hypothetical protein